MNKLSLANCRRALLQQRFSAGPCCFILNLSVLAVVIATPPMSHKREPGSENSRRRKSTMKPWMEGIEVIRGAKCFQVALDALDPDTGVKIQQSTLKTYRRSDTSRSSRQFRGKHGCRWCVETGYSRQLRWVEFNGGVC